MERFWRRSGVLLGKYWILVLGVVVVVTAALIPGLSRLEFATGQDSYLNSDSQIAIDNKSFQEQFGGEVVVLLFRATDGADITELLDGANQEALRTLEEDLRAIGDVVYSVITPYTSVRFSEAIVSGDAGTNALLSATNRETDETATPLRRDDLEITLARRTAIPDEQRDFSNPEWIDFLIFGNDGYAVAGDGVAAPADEARNIRASLRSTFPGDPDDPDDPQDHVAVGGVIMKGNATLDEQSNGTDEVLQITDALELDGFEIITTGSPVYLKEINDYLQDGMLQLGGAAVAVMALVLVFLFRVRWRLLPLAVVLVGVMWSFALLGYLGIELSLVTISGLPILIGLGIDFAIQVHNRVEEEVVLDKEEHPIAESLANVGPALIVATIAAVLAFAALRVSQVPMIRSFGVMLIVGILVLVLTGITLPASWLGIREWRQRTQQRGASRVERLVVWLGSLPSAAGIPLVVASIALFVGGILLEGQFQIESDPLRWIDQDSEAVADVETLGEETGFETTLGILVEANNVFDEDVIAVLHGFTLAAEARPEVVTVSSLVNTMAKVILVEGATPLAPTSQDLVAAREALPPDIDRVLLAPDLTAAQVNMRLAPADLAERAVLIAELRADLEARIAAVELASDSILLVELGDADAPMRAVPSGLAVVGVGLLDNLKANRAVLTYLGLALAALWLLIRFRSVARALLALVPVCLAIGVSSVVIAALGLDLSPLTTVSGPLVIASCTEFSVLILARYLEERGNFDAREASNHASARTGRAFFTSAATTIGGFAVLMVSPLPLLRDFGLIVTLNVGVALLSALVVMPPLMVWADTHGLLPVTPTTGSVRLGAGHDPRRYAITAVATLLVAGGALALFLAAETEEGESTAQAFTVAALPEPEPEPEPDIDIGPIDIEPVDVSSYPTEKPEGLVPGLIFDLLTAQGADPQQANCTSDVLLQQVDEADLLALGADALTLPAVTEAALACGISPEIIDAAIAAGI